VRQWETERQEVGFVTRAPYMTPLLDLFDLLCNASWLAKSWCVRGRPVDLGRSGLTATTVAANKANAEPAAPRSHWRWSRRFAQARLQHHVEVRGDHPADRCEPTCPDDFAQALLSRLRSQRSSDLLPERGWHADVGGTAYPLSGMRLAGSPRGQDETRRRTRSEELISV
jgi:hypothetical protein